METIYRLKKRLSKITVNLILAVLAFLFIFPVLLTFTNSFMSSSEISRRYTSEVTAANHFNANERIHFVEMSIIPDRVTVSQYSDLFFKNPAYMGAFINSLKITIPIVLGQVIIGMTAAYAFEMSKFKYKEIVFFFYVVVMFMPLQVTLVPNYMTVEFLGINGSVWAVILPGIFSPFSVFLSRQYIRGLDKEYVEAARLDGAGEFRIITMIMAPLMKPASSALIILTFTSYWNLVEQAIVFIKETFDEPLSVYLSNMTSDNMGLIFAGSCFYMLPVLIIFFFGRKDLVSGIVNST